MHSETEFAGGWLAAWSYINEDYPPLSRTYFPFTGRANDPESDVAREPTRTARSGADEWPSVGRWRLEQLVREYKSSSRFVVVSAASHSETP